MEMSDTCFIPQLEEAAETTVLLPRCSHGQYQSSGTSVPWHPAGGASLAAGLQILSYVCEAAEGEKSTPPCCHDTL